MLITTHFRESTQRPSHMVGLVRRPGHVLSGRPARVIAQADGRVYATVDWDDKLNREQNHEAAAHKLATQLGWSGGWCGKSTKQGYAFSLSEEDVEGPGFVVFQADIIECHAEAAAAEAESHFGEAETHFGVLFGTDEKPTSESGE